MLRTRLYFGLLPLLLLFIVVGLASIRIYRELARSMEQQLVANYRSMIAAYEMRDAATQMTAAIHDAQSGHVIEGQKTFVAERGRFQKLLMEQSFTSAGTSRAGSIEKISAAFEQLNQVGSAIFSHGGGGSLSSYQETEAALFQTLTALKETTERDYDDMQHAASRMNDIVRTSIDVLAAALVGGILLSLFLSYRLARSLLRPVKALTASAAAFGDGNFDRDVPVTSKDELGKLAQTFNTMAAKLRAYRDASTAKVQRARATMEATLASAPDPLFVIARDGTIEVRNPAAEPIASSPEFADGFPAVLKEKLQEVLQTGNHYLPTDYRHVVTVHLGRDERHYLPRILSIGDELTGFGGAALILNDVTKFRLLDDAKNNLVGTVSHELKTPLTSLRMAVYLLLEQNVGTLSPSQRDLLETARDDADRLLRILNDLLDLARLESGVSALNRREVSIVALLEERAHEMKAIVESVGQRIEVRVAPGLTAIEVDPDRLRHVFINLLSNASKYSPEKSTILLYAEPAHAGFVRFGVRDHGPGIPEGSVSFIFEKFYRVPGQTRKGAGLGLTIAREIVVAHGGTIACTSAVGEGSDFYFILPLQAPEAKAA